MILTIPDMSCGHCVQAITKAVRSVDGDAAVDIDLDKKQAKVDSRADEGAIVAAVEEAGFTVEGRAGQ